MSGKKDRRPRSPDPSHHLDFPPSHSSSTSAPTSDRSKPDDRKPSSRDHHHRHHSHDRSPPPRSRDRSSSDPHSRHSKDRHRDRSRSGSRPRHSHRHHHDSKRRSDDVRDSRSRSRSPRIKSKDVKPSRSRSMSPHSNGSAAAPRSRRTSGFDVPPSPGVTPVVNPFLPIAAAALPNPAMSNPLAVKHAKRVYVGRLPPGANEQSIATFFNQVMQAVGGTTYPGDPVVNVYVNYDKNFSFVEMRTVEEATNAMALDGIIFGGIAVSVRRPTDYDPACAAMLGPIQPNPQLNLAAVGLTSRSIVNGCPHKIFVGGLPHHFREEEVKSLLEAVGPLHGLDLVKDNETGNSKGYAFCVYQDPNITDYVCSVLNGVKIGDRTLTVRRAAAGSERKPDEKELQQQLAVQQSAGVPYSFIAGQLPAVGTVSMESATKVLCLAQLVSVDELRDDQEYEDIYQDIREECNKFGNVVNLVIPRPSTNDEDVPGLGKAFVEYSDLQGSIKAKAALNGRGFGGNIVRAVYYPEDNFARGELNAIAL